MSARRIASLTIAVGLIIGASADARSLWPSSDDGRPVAKSLITDPTAREEGDILTILISEQTQSSVQAQNQNGQDTSGGLSAGQGLLSFIPFFSYGANDSYDASGQQTWSGTFTTRMTAMVKEVQENGLLMIEGTRTVDVNGEKQELVLSGLVRPLDISRNNTIASEQIADARIEYRGGGPIGQKSKPGVLTRLLDWLF